MAVSRRALLAVAALAPLAVSCSGGPAALEDDFTAVPDGPLAGRRADSGHRWIAETATDDAARPVVRGGALGPARPATGTAVTAGYAVVDLARPVTRVGADVRWDRSSAPTCGFALGAFTWPASGLSGRRPGPPDAGSPLHLAVAPGYVEFAVFSHGIRPPTGDYTTLAPDSGGPPRVELAEPMRCDGDTTYRVEVERDDDTAQVRVGDNDPITFRHPLIARPATFPFFEHFLLPGGTNLPRFLRTRAE